MIGAIIGDIVGSIYEWNNNRSKDFPLFGKGCFATDDSIMSLAVAKALLDCNDNYDDLSAKAIKAMQEVGRPYPRCGFGGSFYNWIYTDNPKPYHSYGNGAAMRISAVGFVAKDTEQAKELAYKVTAVSHNHPEGIKGAESVAVAIVLAKQGWTKEDIKTYVCDNYYKIDFTLNEIRDTYKFNETCQDTVPQAFEAFFESTSFEDAIRNAISVGGDSDTLAAITGGIAEAYYGVPSDIRAKAEKYLDRLLITILDGFETLYGTNTKEMIETCQNQGNGLVNLPIKCYNNEYKCKEVQDDIRRKGQDSKGTTVHESRSLCESTGGVVCDGESMGAGTMQTELSGEEALSRLLRTEFNKNRGLTGRMKTNKNKGIEIEETTSQRLFNHLFEACNILRGPINQDEFKDYITPLLFFKRLSDVYDEETALALEKSGGDAEYASMDCNHRFIIPSGCHWNNVRETVTDVGQSIVNAMTSIERANPETLQGVFSSFDEASWTNKGKLDDARLRDLVEHMSKINVGNKNYSADVMGDSYEFLLKRFADESNSNAGEFYTPRAAVKLLIKILAPQPGETVYDPACGTGGMLIEAIRYMNDDKLSYGKIYGQEKNLSTSAIARMNLFLHGAEDFKVLQGDTLRSPLFMEYGEIKRFDCVIANPPFSLENWGASVFASDVYGRNIYGFGTS